MESLLERGEKLDDLVQKSEHLGNQSKAFYKTVSMNYATLSTYVHTLLRTAQDYNKSLCLIHICLTLCTFVYLSGTEAELVL